jgi:protein-disulfide isomerase
MSARRRQAGSGGSNAAEGNTLADEARLWANSRHSVSPRLVQEPSPVAFAIIRRIAGAALLCAVALGSPNALADAAPKPDGTVDMAKVLQPGPLPEMAMGNPSGVPVIEYGSLTCPHCAAFSKETFPELKKDYIDNGKVRFIFREFARNTLDVAGFVLARCLGDDKAFAANELLFAEQDKWAFVDKPLEPLIAAMRPAGLTADKAKECLNNQKLADAIVAITKRASDEVHLTGTPTFIIDGKVYGGELTFEQLKAILDPLVKK